MKRQNFLATQILELATKSENLGAMQLAPRLFFLKVEHCTGKWRRSRGRKRRKRLIKNLLHMIQDNEVQLL